MAWSFLQSVSSTGVGVTSLTVTYSSNVTAGSKLITAVASGLSSDPTSVQDAALNSEVKLVSVNGTPSGTVDGSLWAMDTPAGDVGTTPAIKVSSASTDLGVLLQEVSGLATGTTAAAMIDGGTGGAGTTTFVPAATSAQPAYTSAAANEYLVAVYGDNGGPATYTVPGAYTADTHGVNTSSTDDIEIAYKNSTGGAESGTWSFSGTFPGAWFIVTAFKLAPAAVSPGQAKPGQTWRRQFHHRQLPVPPVVVAAAGTPAPLYPLQQPVRTRLTLPPRGTAHGSPGIYGQLGPPVTPLRGPVQGWLRLRQGGRVRGNPGVYDQLGPALTPLKQPVRGQPPAHRSGWAGWDRGTAGVFDGTGPPLTPLKQPVRSQPRLLPPRGRAQGNPGVFDGTGPAVTPLRAPVRGRNPLRRPGWSRGTAGVYGQLGPVLTPLRAPVKARQPLPPRGRAQGSQGKAVTVVLTSGPPLTPLSQPVRARPKLPPPGRAMAIGPLFVTTVTATSGPAFEPLGQPAGARVSLWRTGHIQSSPGTFGLLGPPFPGWDQPVRPKLPLARGGRAMTMVALNAVQLPVSSGPPLTPLRQPVRAKPKLPPPGRAMAMGPLSVLTVITDHRMCAAITSKATATGTVTSIATGTATVTSVLASSAAITSGAATSATSVLAATATVTSACC